MKIIIERNTNIVLFAFTDHTDIHIKKNRINTPELNISNTKNMKLIENVKDTPNDFIGRKYKYSRKKWSINRDWSDPITAE